MGCGSSVQPFAEITDLLSQTLHDVKPAKPVLFDRALLFMAAGLVIFCTF